MLICTIRGGVKMAEMGKILYFRKRHHPDLQKAVDELLGRGWRLRWSVRRRLKRILAKTDEIPAALQLGALKRAIENLNYAIDTIELSASARLPNKSEE